MVFINGVLQSYFLDLPEGSEVLIPNISGSKTPRTTAQRACPTMDSVWNTASRKIQRIIWEMAKKNILFK